MVDNHLMLACNFIHIVWTMYGMALSNPAGVQFDFLLRMFGLRFVAGIFLLIAIYGFHSVRSYRKQELVKQAHHHDTERLSKQMLLRKMQGANDKELVELLVAYLEKFHTKTGAHSLSSLLAWAKFSENEIAELKVVNYGKGKLSEWLREKILKRMNIE